MGESARGVEGTLDELGPELLGEIMALLAHDLRNPLAALSSNVGYLGLVGGLSGELREALFDLQLSVEALARVSDSLETVSQELRHSPAPPTSQVSCASLVAGLLPGVERAAQSYGVRLVVELGSERKLLVAETSFARALSNLLHNAVSLAPEKSEVRLVSYDQGAHVVFRVEDRAATIEQGEADLAFSARGQLELKSKLSGRYTRGLGLYVVARSAHRAGAEVRVAERAEGSALELVAPAAS